MKPLSILTALIAFLPFSPFVSAVNLIESNSLVPCGQNSNFTTTLFNVAFFPGNSSLSVHVIGVSSIEGNVNINAEVLAYGYSVLDEDVDPCKIPDLKGMCPMRKGSLKLETSVTGVSQDIISKIPNVAYSVPDIDLKVRINVNSTETGENIACLTATLQNDKTVYHKAVGWVVAVIAGLGLVASAVTSGLGHSNTAAHVAANALSLFGFFQAQAMIGLSSVKLPPIVQSWTQNFQWSMGIIRVGFLQSICTWYQRATGGTPSTLLTSLSTNSVQMYKRSLEVVGDMAVDHFVKRSNRDDANGEHTGTTIVRGIERVAFRAGMEKTNVFLTGLIFFVFFVAITMGLVALFKGWCEVAAKSGWMKGDKFQDFRHGWKIVMRGILFRLTLIGFPQMSILCLWEFTERDSPAEVVLAVFMFISICGALGWASFKVIKLAKRSVEMHKNPAYILYSDPSALNKWGFLYVQYRATAYYCLIPVLGYILIKAMFIAFAQPAPVVQAVALFVIELAVLIAASVMRPWMDKKTNIFNISIAAVNFLNVLLLLFFSEVFNQPGLVTGVMGVIFFVINAAFALILLLLVLIASIYAIVSKNPETRYQPMRDDRGSFIKSQTQLTTELDALGATARGETKTHDLEDDISYSRSSFTRQQHDNGAFANKPPHSPVDPSVPLFPSSDNQSPFNRAQNSSPVPRDFNTSPFPRPGTSNSNPHAYRQANTASPWQRGAGYDH